MVTIEALFDRWQPVNPYNIFLELFSGIFESLSGQSVTSFDAKGVEYKQKTTKPCSSAIAVFNSKS